MLDGHSLCLSLCACMWRANLLYWIQRILSLSRDICVPLAAFVVLQHKVHSGEEEVHGAKRNRRGSICVPGWTVAWCEEPRWAMVTAGVAKVCYKDKIVGEQDRALYINAYAICPCQKRHGESKQASKHLLERRKIKCLPTLALLIVIFSFSVLSKFSFHTLIFFLS